MNETAKVYLQHQDNYTISQLKRIFDSYFAKRAGVSWRSAAVFIKPNLISAKFSGPACTDPRFIQALAEWFIDNGSSVAVGDSPAIGKASGVLRALQVDDKLKKLGVEIIDFNNVTKKRLECGIEIGLATEPLQYDYLVNAPKVKAHTQMYVTLAVKNIFGIVKGMRKAMLHMRFGDKDNIFSQIILDLLKVLPRNFSALDGIEAMTRQGPLHGDRLFLGCVGFAEDPVALDTSIMAALKLNPSKSKLWREAKSRNYRGADLMNISFPILSPDYFHSVSFEAPTELSPIRFSPFHFLRGNLKRLQSGMIGK